MTQPPTSRTDRPAQDLEHQLLAGLREQPERKDLRLRLLRMYFIANRAEDFLREATPLRKSASAVEWEAVEQMGRFLAPDASLFNLALDDPSVPLSAPTARTVRRFGESQAAAPHLKAIADAFNGLPQHDRFFGELEAELAREGRPSPLYHARRLTESVGGAQIYLKREDISPPGIRLVANILGQALLARRMGRKELVTGTVDGRKGRVMAGAAARLGLSARVFMEKSAIDRERANVFQMQMMGAKIEAVEARLCKNRDVREPALEYWLKNQATAFLIMGLDAGPEPYPTIAGRLAGVVGRECRKQASENAGKLPDLVVARGSRSPDAIGLFDPFLQDSTRLVCVEPPTGSAAGGSLDQYDPFAQHLDKRQQFVANAILEGIEYPSVTREHANLRASGRVEYVTADSRRAQEMIELLSRMEGMLPALETAAALAWACEAAREMPHQKIVVVMYAERSEKDIWDIARGKGQQV
jgi:tryptophan synthase beta chain